MNTTRPLTLGALALAATLSFPAPARADDALVSAYAYCNAYSADWCGEGQVYQHVDFVMSVRGFGITNPDGFDYSAYSIYPGCRPVSQAVDVRAHCRKLVEARFGSSCVATSDEQVVPDNWGPGSLYVNANLSLTCAGPRSQITTALVDVARWAINVAPVGKGAGKPEKPARPQRP